jgi:polysaccharide export outer membrane protein
MVRLKIWREPDLSGDYAVDESGQVVFPKIGPLTVTRISADSLKSLLITTYATYLRNPSVEVTLLRRVNVLGAVRNPGLYQVDPTMTLVDVLAMAGGRTPDGQKDRVDLLRQGEPEPLHLRVESRVGDAVHSGDQLIVPERSWTSRNSTALVAAVITSVAIVAAAALYH